MAKAVNTKKRRKVSVEEDPEVLEKNTQPTLSKFFSFKSSKSTECSQQKTTKESPKTIKEVKIVKNAPLFHSRSKSEEACTSTEQSNGNKRKRPLIDEDNTPTPSTYNPGNESSSDSPDPIQSCEKVSDLTRSKLSNFSCQHSEENATNTPPIKLDSLKQKLNFREDKISDGLSQDSGVNVAYSVTNSQLDDSDNNEDDLDEPSTSKKSKASTLLSKFSRVKEDVERSKVKMKEVGKSGAAKHYTPLEKQFLKIREEYPDTILFVECGYKYRFFGQDAETASKELNIYCHMDHNFMTASIPVHRLHVHVRRLVSNGYKVGIVKQTETAALKAAGENKTGPFTRELTALYTKATLIGEDVDPVFSANSDADTTPGVDTGTYLMAIYTTISSECADPKKNKTRTIAVVAVQPATGTLVYDEFQDSLTRAALETRISHIGPVELLLPVTADSHTENLIQQLVTMSPTPTDRMRIERRPDKVFDYDTCVTELTQFYNSTMSSSDEDCSTKMSEVLGLPKNVICCLGGLLSYLKDFNLHNVLKLTSNFEKFSMDSGYMKLNACTVRNLEIFHNATNGQTRGSLFWVMDQTQTKFGGRLLHQWLTRPLLCHRSIEERLGAVEYLVDSPGPVISRLKETFSKLPDVEKGLGTIYHKKCSTGEFLSVCLALEGIYQLMRENEVDPGASPELPPLLHRLTSELPELLGDIQDHTGAINHQAARQGNKTVMFVRESDYPQVVAGKQAIADLTQQLVTHRKEVRLKLHAPALDFVSVQGVEFLVEVRNTKTKTVPADWIRINSTKALSRYHTPFIVTSYRKLNQLREQLKLDCEAAWITFLESFEACYLRYKRAVQHLATLDCLMSLAKLALQPGFVRPQFIEGSTQLQITKGRHPVVDVLLGDQEQYVPNDTNLNGSTDRCMIITGPNMGGKSSYIKQVALLVVMAQMGSYIPAESAELRLVDAIYTRMGAEDDLFRGRSTFMLELQETSDIISSASDRSLVILDELGRGTSTHDGVAIALATLRYFVEEVKCMTLFVTHYALLTETEKLYPSAVQNYHMSFLVHDEREGNDYDLITFLYELVRGTAGNSYGLNVARLADIPKDILQVAALKSRQIEEEVSSRRNQRSAFLSLMTADAENMKKRLENFQDH